MFHDRYLRKNSIHSEVEFRETETFLQGFEEDCAEENGNTEALDVRQKYNLILPLALQIASLASNHGTCQFNKYVDSLKTIESMVRQGKDLHFSDSQATTDQSTTDQGTTDQEASVSQNSDSTSTALSSANSESVTALVKPSENDVDCRSRFNNLKFKTKLKSRGRPKRPARQLCSFNRSVADKRKEPDPDPDEPCEGPVTRKRAKKV